MPSLPSHHFSINSIARGPPSPGFQGPGVCRAPGLLMLTGMNFTRCKHGAGHKHCIPGLSGICLYSARATARSRLSYEVWTTSGRRDEGLESHVGSQSRWLVVLEPGQRRAWLAHAMGGLVSPQPAGRLAGYRP